MYDLSEVHPDEIDDIKKLFIAFKEMFEYLREERKYSEEVSEVVNSWIMDQIEDVSVSNYILSKTMFIEIFFCNTGNTHTFFGRFE